MTFSLLTPMVHDSLVTICDEGESDIAITWDSGIRSRVSKYVSSISNVCQLCRWGLLTSRSLTLYFSEKETIQAMSSVLFTKDEHMASNCGDLASSSLMSSGRTGLPLPRKSSDGVFRISSIGATTPAVFAISEPLCGVPKKKMA